MFYEENYDKIKFIYIKDDIEWDFRFKTFLYFT